MKIDKRCEPINTSASNKVTRKARHINNCMSHPSQDIVLNTGSCKVAYEVLLWPSMVTLLDEAGVDLKNRYAPGDELVPELLVYGHAQDNNGSDRHFSVLVDRFGTGTKSSREYSSDGHLKLNTSKVNSYLATFMSCIFIMDPFLDATDLRTMRDGFITRYIPQSQLLASLG
jgi:hypothetical protein